MSGLEPWAEVCATVALDNKLALEAALPSLMEFVSMIEQK